MSLSTIKSVITDFLRADDCQVMAIKGSWGTGKTFLWQQLILTERDAIKPKKYSYVSLFGITSLAQLRTAVFAKTVSSDAIGETLSLSDRQHLFGRLVHKGKSGASWVANVLSGFKVGQGLSVALETVAPYFITDTLVCLDDFERLPKQGPSIEELLGFISELKVEKSCKVVLIFNEDEISDRLAYAKYREKVIDIELHYDLLPAEAIDLAVPRKLPGFDIVKRHCELLDIKNIRILTKIVRLLEKLHPYVSHLHARVYEQSVHTGILLSWCYFGEKDKVPAAAFLQKWDSLLFRLNGKDEPPSEMETAWATLLNGYGMGRLDAFDNSIWRVIEKGYVEESGFIITAQILDEQCRADDLNQQFSNAWRLYRNSFDDNEEDVIAGLIDTACDSIAQLSLMDLSSTCLLLRYFGKDTEANNLIDLFANAWGQKSKDFDIHDHPFMSDIRDPKIHEVFAARQQSTFRRTPLPQLAQAIIENSLDKDQTESLKLASVGDYVTLFKQDHGDKLEALIRSCLRFSNHAPEYRKIADNAHAALQQIGQESRLNARRVSAYDVHVESKHE